MYSNIGLPYQKEKTKTNLICGQKLWRNARKLFDWRWRSFASFPFIRSFNLQKMASEELVTEQFQFFGIDVPKEVLSKCEYPNNSR